MSTVAARTALLDLAGRRARLAFAFWRAVRRFPALLGLSILAMLFTAIGLALLVVPGIIAMIITSAGAKSCIVERTGPWESLRRGAHLTKGNRWRLFGFSLCCFLIALLPSILKFGMALLLAGAGGMLAHLFGALLQIVFQWAVSIYLGFVGAVVYHDLVLLRDGVASEAIADALEH